MPEWPCSSKGFSQRKRRRTNFKSSRDDSQQGLISNFPFHAFRFESTSLSSADRDQDSCGQGGGEASGGVGARKGGGGSLGVEPGAGRVVVDFPPLHVSFLRPALTPEPSPAGCLSSTKKSSSEKNGGYNCLGRRGVDKREEKGCATHSPPQTCLRHPSPQRPTDKD